MNKPLWPLAATGLAIFLTGCAGLGVAPDKATEQQAYRKAIMDAAVIEAGEIRPLPTIPPGKVRVVTWTKFPDSYPMGKPVALKWGEVWVTLAGDVKNRCRQFPAATAVSDVQKLLGLPADNAEKRNFVTLEVDTASMFRPCANPGLQDKSCSPTLPDDVPASHAAWYARQSSQSYQLDGGFPWTRLGYTYNWKNGANEVGVPEFVIRKGASVLPLASVATGDYCKP